MEFIGEKVYFSPLVSAEDAATTENEEELTRLMKQNISVSQIFSAFNPPPLFVPELRILTY